MSGYDAMTTKILSIYICQEETKYSFSDEVDSTLSSGTICEDTDVYEFDVEKIFDVEVET